MYIVLNVISMKCSQNTWRNFGFISHDFIFNFTNLYSSDTVLEMTSIWKTSLYSWCEITSRSGDGQLTLAWFFAKAREKSQSLQSTMYIIRMSFVLLLSGSCLFKSWPLDACSSTWIRKSFWWLGTTINNSVTFASCLDKNVFWNASYNKHKYSVWFYQKTRRYITLFSLLSNGQKGCAYS